MSDRPELAALSILLHVGHLGLAGIWLGAMAYSLLVVQPRAARFFGSEAEHEEFLLTLGAGNRRPVLAVLAGLVVTGALIPVTTGPTAAQAALYVAEGALLGSAAAIFARVSWLLWPRRAFALPDEWPVHRAALRRHALAMVGLVGGAFTLAVVAATLPT